MPVFSSPLRFRQQASASTPATGETAMWMGTDGNLRTKNPDGIERALAGMVYDDTGWIEPTLQNGWVNYNQGWETVGYRRVNGIVYLKGLIAGGTTTDGLAFFTLPVGFRPGSDKHIATASANTHATVKVRTTGLVGNGTPVNSAWLSLANISFPAEDYVPPTAFTRALDQTTVVSGPKVNAAGTTAFLRGSEVIVNVNATTTAATVAGEVLFTLPVGYRPSTTIFVTLDNANPDPPVAVRFHVETNGNVTFQGANGVASGIIFRGSFTVPVGLSVTYGGATDRHEIGLLNTRRITKLATYENGSGNIPGYMVIQTNMTFANIMTRLHITGYNYQPTNNVIDSVITMYPFANDSGIYNTQVANMGSFMFSDVQILTRNSDGKIAIALQSSASGNYWQYPKIWVDGIFGHTLISDAQAGGWNITMETSLSAYTLKTRPNNPSPSLEDTGWTNLSLINNWVPYATNGSAWGMAGYRRKDGWVTLRGLVTKTIGSTAEVVGYLPVGYRPGSHRLLASDCAGGHVRLDIQSDGAVVFPAGVSNVSYASIATTFLAEL